eukprot:4456999-Amphidinium_carterae.1
MNSWLLINTKLSLTLAGVARVSTTCTVIERSMSKVRSSTTLLPSRIQAASKNRGTQGGSSTAAVAIAMRSARSSKDLSHTWQDFLLVHTD